MYSNEENIAKMFLLYFNKTCDMLLRKVQQSYCYTQLCNNREEFLSKPIISQFNIVVSCNLSFTRSLNASYIDMDE